MDLNKISLSRPWDLEYILRRPLDAISFLSPEEIVRAMESTAQKITVHLYPVGPPSRRKQKCLLDYNRWSYHQMYLALQDGKIFACIGHGNTSAARQHHNNLIDLFLQNKKLREETGTAVLAASKGNILASCFHAGYAYSNHDIGHNWDHAIIEKLRSSRLSYSFHTYLPRGGHEIKFKASRDSGILVYRAVRLDNQHGSEADVRLG